MTGDELKKALSTTIGKVLATDLVRDFLIIRQDALTGTLERANAGKFVETVVQALQYMERAGAYDAKPSVDDYLSKLESRTVSLDDGLKVVAARVARSMYTLRNKRNIAHKGAVDPNQYDLRFLHHGAQWVMAELLRHASGITMAEAGSLIERVQEPIGGLVEDRGDRKLVLTDVLVHEEILILLNSIYPKSMTLKELASSMNRRASDSVRKAAKSLWDAKQVDGEPSKGYGLTSKGVDSAAAVVRRIMTAASSAAGSVPTARKPKRKR